MASPLTVKNIHDENNCCTLNTVKRLSSTLTTNVSDIGLFFKVITRKYITGQEGGKEGQNEAFCANMYKVI